MNEVMDKLRSDVRSLAGRLVSLGEVDLGTPYAWGSYDSEGIRFAVFRVIEELDLLRAALGAQNAGLSQAARILGGYHRAYRDLEAVVWGIDDDAAVIEPGGDQWSVRKIYTHLLGADFGFLVVTRFAWELHQAGEWSAEREFGDAEYDRILETDEARYNQLMESPLSALRSAHDRFHDKVLDELSGITDAELDLPSKYWESETYPLRFRLGRFASHMRQHTIQIEKTLPLIGLPITEGRMLVRQLFNRLAEIENTGGEVDEALVRPAQDEIRLFTDALPA